MTRGIDAQPRIGVTAGVELRDGAVPPRHGYMSDSQIHRALAEAGAAPIILPHHIDAIDTFLDMVDGVLIAGGGYQFPDPLTLISAEASNELGESAFRTRASFELALARACLNRDMPTLGICGGFQVMNSILGGKLVVNLAAERPAWGAHLAPPANFLAHDLEIRPNTMLRALVKDARIVVNSLHRQGVVETGAEAVAAAVSDDGLIEALEVQRHPFFLGVQWHPEFLLRAADHDLMQGFVAASATQRSRSR